MVVVHQLAELAECEHPLHIAIGMFDGVHIGHQAVIETCQKSARNTKGKAAVLTFWPHPSHFFKPEDPVPQIMTLKSKLWTLWHRGLDYTIVHPFNESIASIEAEDFLTYLKTSVPTLHTLYVGENFRFGKGRSGDINLLGKISNDQGIDLVSMQPCNYNAERISSTRIRDLLKEGRFNDTRQLLGHPYTAIGEIESGRGVGRTIGYPTLNLDWSPQLRPPYGVYAVRVFSYQLDGRDSKTLTGVANYGIRPTYKLSDDPVLEVHMFGDPLWDSGERVAVELIEFIRPEKAFESPEALIRQIDRDVESAKKALKSKS